MDEEERKAAVEKAIEKSWNSQGRVKIANYAKEVGKSARFLARIDELRKKYDIPIKGFPPDEEGNRVLPPEDWTPRFTDKDRQLRREVHKLCDNYGLHFLEWSAAVELVLFYNGPLEALQGADLCMLTDLSEEAEEPYTQETQDADNLFFPIAIRISPQATQRDIIDFIEKHAFFIKQMQEFHLKEVRGQKIGKVKKKDPKTAERNDFIYEHRHLSRKEIMHALAEKFGPDGIIDYGHISKVISLEKKRRKEL